MSASLPFPLVVPKATSECVVSRSSIVKGLPDCLSVLYVQYFICHPLIPLLKCPSSLQCNECPRDERLFEIRGQAPMTLAHLEEIEAVRARDEAAKTGVSVYLFTYFSL